MGSRCGEDEFVILRQQDSGLRWRGGTGIVGGWSSCGDAVESGHHIPDNEVAGIVRGRRDFLAVVKAPGGGRHSGDFDVEVRRGRPFMSCRDDANSRAGTILLNRQLTEYESLSDSSALLL